MSESGAGDYGKLIKNARRDVTRLCDALSECSGRVRELEEENARLRYEDAGRLSPSERAANAHRNQAKRTLGNQPKPEDA